MAAGALLFVLVFGIAVTLGLYLLIAAETSNPRLVDRETATREAKAQGGVRSGSADRRRAASDDREPDDEHGDDYDHDEYGWLDDDEHR